MNGTMVPVAWPAASFPIAYRLDQRLVQAFPGANGALERAFNVWTTAPNSNVSFRSSGVGSGLRAGRDGETVVTMTDDLFKDQKAIAITTTWDDRGVVTEADIQIDTSLTSSSYNVQQAITHEIGHLLGLDHSGVMSAVMYPYVSRGTDVPMLDSDDRIAIAGMYPKGDPTMTGGTLQGRVMGDSGGIFAAQIVAMNENGEPVATTLTNAAGEFILQGIPDGMYRLYAEPLDGPMETRNLAPAWRQNTAESFPTHFLEGNPLPVQSGRVYGNLVLTARGAPVELNPRWIGLAPGSGSDFDLSSTARTVKPGQTFTLAVAGDGIIGGMTTFEPLSPGFRRLSPFQYAGNYLYATYEVSGQAPSGSVVIVVNSGTQTATLTGAVRVLGTPAPGRTRITRR